MIAPLLLCCFFFSPGWRGIPRRPGGVDARGRPSGPRQRRWSVR
nr:MAG TPA: hypothetical protein [Caudoviricetes sp.]